MINKRIPEASALRGFFQEQWEHLQRLIDERRLNKRQQQREAKGVANAVESIVEGTDSRLRALGNYQKRLRKSARELLDYIEGLVADIPPAVEISQAAYANNSLVNTLFANSQAMHQLFSRSAPVQTYFDDVDNLQRQEMFALLFLNRLEKNILGAEIRGEILVKDVPQTSVSFSGHQLIAPQPTEEAARSALKRTLFESVILQLKQHITQLRYGQTDEEKLASVQNPQYNINNPEVYIEMLAEQLSLPKKLLNLQDNLLRVSKMGIRLPLGSTDPSSEIRLHEVTIKGENSRAVMLVCYPRAEYRPPPAELSF